MKVLPWKMIGVVCAAIIGLVQVSNYAIDQINGAHDRHARNDSAYVWLQQLLPEVRMLKWQHRRDSTMIVELSRKSHDH